MKTSTPNSTRAISRDEEALIQAIADKMAKQIGQVVVHYRSTSLQVMPRVKQSQLE